MIGVPSHPFLRALQFFPARHLVYRLLLCPVSLTPLMLLVFRYPGGGNKRGVWVQNPEVPACLGRVGSSKFRVKLCSAGRPHCGVIRHATKFSVGENTAYIHSTESFLQELKEEDYANRVLLIKGARSFQFEKIVKHFEQKIHGTVLEIDLNALVDLE